MANANPLSALVLAQALLPKEPQPLRNYERSPWPRRDRHVFLAEHYVPAVDSRRVDVLARLVASAAGDRRRRDVVSLLGIVGLPSDESLMSLFDAPGADAVAETLDRAGVPADRIVRVLWRSGRYSGRD